jgi:hypothetical protein
MYLSPSIVSFSFFFITLSRKKLGWSVDDGTGLRGTIPLLYNTFPYTAKSISPFPSGHVLTPANRTYLYALACSQ